MLIGDIPPTSWDLHFSVGPFPVRVSPTFFLMGLILSGGTNDGASLIAGTLAVFLSILIHELGHCLAFARFGIASHIVLYHLGGLAIPDTSFRGMGRAMALGPREQIIVSAAGPLLEMAVGVLCLAGLALGGFDVSFAGNFLASWFPHSGFQQLPPFLQHFFYVFIYVSTYWALINLIPVYPLDGGQIARHAMILAGFPNAIHDSLMLSVGAGALAAIWMGSQQQTFMALMFAMLAYSSYQQLQYNGRW